MIQETWRIITTTIDLFIFIQVSPHEPFSTQIGMGDFVDTEKDCQVSRKFALK
jgi:hypothetical protein